MKTIRTIDDLHAELRGVFGVGLVPTMGAFHDGHLSLIRAAREENDVVVVSLFVNPSQFDEAADLAAYPRDESRDLLLAEEEGVDIVFAPSVDEMYPPGFQTWIDVEEASRGLEGDARPGHFRGVATVCLKLFTIVQPETAYFGQKDAQQVVVVRRLVRDLNLAGRDPRAADGARAGRPCALVPQRAALAGRAPSARSRCRRRSKPAPTHSPPAAIRSRRRALR